MLCVDAPLQLGPPLQRSQRDLALSLSHSLSAAELEHLLCAHKPILEAPLELELVLVHCDAEILVLDDAEQALSADQGCTPSCKLDSLAPELSATTP